MEIPKEEKDQVPQYCIRTRQQRNVHFCSDEPCVPQEHTYLVMSHFAF